MTASVLKQNPNMKGLKECLSKTQWHAEVLLNLSRMWILQHCNFNYFITHVRSMLSEETEVFILV